MGCGSCGSGSTPGGCQSHGSCSTGSCNRMNVHDWLANLPFSDPESSCKIVEVSFNNGSRKDYYRNNTNYFFEKGDMIAVEGISGFDVGMVNVTGELVRLQLKKHEIKEDHPDIKKVLRRANEADLTKLKETKAKEKDMLIRSRAIARQLKLELKMAEVEIQADGRKATFFYIADDRVDFRELIKLYAGEFRVKVEMKQIGARQEAGKVGGIGSCGRELCCSTWLTDFKSVNTNAARYQNLSINQTKLSGQCGRLKCCLNYELDTYLDSLQHFPDDCEVIEVAKGRAFLVKKDIFKNLMWYTMQESNKHYPLSLDRVKKIKSLNRQGIKPDDLEPVEVTSGKPKEIEPEYADVVGQISLRSLEKNSRRRREKERNENSPNRQQRPPQNKGGQNPQQAGPQNKQQNNPQAPRNTNQQRPQQNRPQGGGQQRHPQQNRGPQGQKQGGQPNKGGQNAQGGQPNRPQNNRQAPRNPNPNNQAPRQEKPGSTDNKPE